MLAADRSWADTRTDTYQYPSTILSNGGGGASNTQSISLPATFNDFDPADGTLTGIVFTFDYEVTFNYQGDGGTGGGLTTKVEINGDATTTFGGAPLNEDPFFPSALYNGSTTISAKSSAPVTPDNALSTFVGSGTFTFGLAGTVGFGSDPESSEHVTSVVLDPDSNVVVTYTFTPSGVHEPSTWVLLGVGAAGLYVTLRRRSPARLIA